MEDPLACATLGLWQDHIPTPPCPSLPELGTAQQSHLAVLVSMRASPPEPLLGSAQEGTLGKSGSCLLRDLHTANQRQPPAPAGLVWLKAMAHGATGCSSHDGVKAPPLLNCLHSPRPLPSP